jgi:hypothetical protein
MDNKKILQQKNKQPRTITMAENWKKKEIKNTLLLRDEMIANNINDKLIKQYLEDQYNRINKEYNNKIEKYYKNEKQKENRLINKNLKIKRNKAIEFLLKNKSFLEEKGVDAEYIKKYVEKQYEEINHIYTLDPEANINLEAINFIDSDNDI